jgi:hypothetical protein
MTSLFTINTLQMLNSNISLGIMYKVQANFCIVSGFDILCNLSVKTQLSLSKKIIN